MNDCIVKKTLLLGMLLMQIVATRSAFAQATGEVADPMLVMVQTRIEQSPDHADSWRLLGKIHQQRGNTNEAVQAYQHALQLDPECVAAHFDLGKLWLGLGNGGEAERNFLQVMSLAPTSSYAATLVEERLVEAPQVPHATTPDSVDGDVSAKAAQPISYQIQTFDGADDLDQRVHQLQSELTTKPRRWRAFIEGGALYNSNVSLTPTSRELRDSGAASAQAFWNPDVECVLLDRGNQRFGMLTRGYFSVNENNFRAFNLSSFQGGAFAEQDGLLGDKILIGRTEYVYVLDLLDAKRFGDRHTITSSLTSLRHDGGLTYLYGAVSFAQFANDGINAATDSLDGNTYTAGLSQVFQTGRSHLQSWSLGGDLELAKTEGADFRYFSYGLHADSTLVVTPRWNLIPEVGVGYRDYHAFTGPESRNSVVWRAALRSRFQLTKGLSVSGVSSFDRFASQNELFDSERVQLGIVTTFLY